MDEEKLNVLVCTSKHAFEVSKANHNALKTREVAGRQGGAAFANFYVRDRAVQLTLLGRKQEYLVHDRCVFVRWGISAGVDPKETHDLDF